MNPKLFRKFKPFLNPKKLTSPPRKQTGNRSLWKRLFGATIALAAGLSASCSEGTHSPGQRDGKQSAVPVEVTTIARGPIERVLMASSSLEAEQEVRIIARTANRVVRLLVEEGDLVAEDQLLAKLEDDIQKTALAKTENQTAKAREEFKRQESLYQQNLISAQAYHNSRYDLKQLELSVEDAKRELAYTEIRASIAGTIARRFLKLGDEVSNGQHLFDIVDFNSIVARLFVPDKELSVLELNQETRVTANALPGKQFKAHIGRISPIVEANSGMIKVTIAFNDIGPLRPGMYINAGIVVETKLDAILIPQRALIYDGDQQFVFRLKPGRRVEKLQIDPGLEDAFMVESKSEIHPGDQIIIAGQTGLKDGTLVRLPGDPQHSVDSAEKNAAEDE